VSMDPDESDIAEDMVETPNPEHRPRREASGRQRQKMKGKKRVEKGVKTCINCGSTETPLWRRNYCNACALYKKHHQGEDRPLDMQMRPKVACTKKTPRAERERKEPPVKPQAEWKQTKPTRTNPQREKRRLGFVLDPNTPVDDEDDEDSFVENYSVSKKRGAQYSARDEVENVPPKKFRTQCDERPASVFEGTPAERAEPEPQALAVPEPEVEAELPAEHTTHDSDAESEMDEVTFPLQVRSNYCSGPRTPYVVEEADPVDEPLTQNDGIQITTPEQSVSPEMFGALWGDEDPSYIPEPHLDLTSQDSPSSSVRSGSSVHSDTTVEMEVDSHYRSEVNSKAVMGEAGEHDVEDWLNILSWEEDASKAKVSLEAEAVEPVGR